jgi:mannose-1-phosphate guanylyltransferase
MNEFKPVIIAGGSGTRLWPLSRSKYPKQFLTLCGEHSMLQQTMLRLDGLPYHAPTLICNTEHRFIVAEQLRQLNVKNAAVLLEPFGRNTAPAIALAALEATAQHADPVLLVLAADHVIADKAAFHLAIKQGMDLASDDQLVTFGIVPGYAETGYGYIKKGNAIDSHGFRVERFVEKPNKETALGYVSSGEYLWNSGMFMFKASVFLRELKLYRPDIYEYCLNAWQNKIDNGEFTQITAEHFANCPEDSIDFAVMEKTSFAAVVPLDAGWNDVGGFAALWSVNDKDAYGNVLPTDAYVSNSQNNYVHADKQLVALVGVEDLVVVSTKDALLVTTREQSQHVKPLINQLKADHRSELELHREVYRPWGKYDSVDSGERFQVKRITVKPGAKLSVQMHHHRAEHWIVVSGTALVTIDGQEQYLTENQSVYIPSTSIHALENPGKVPLELIEVQSGSYLGEDDIVRFEDRYGRV